MNNNSPISTLYVSDLDGTLLNEHSQVSAESAAMLNEAIERFGAQFTCATPRTPATIVPLMQNIHMQLPMIAMAGAAMWNPVRSAYENVRTIGEAQIRQIVGIYERHGARPFVYRHHGGIIEAYHSAQLSAAEREFVEPRSHTPLKRFVLGNGYGSADDEAMIIFSIDRYDLLKQVYTDIVQEVQCSPVCYHDIFDPDAALLEIYAPGVSKAAAVQRMQAEVGAEQLVVFGDNRNDIPMMQVATRSVAVENAFPEVKAIAHEIIPPNTANAVPHYISHHPK